MCLSGSDSADKGANLALYGDEHPTRAFDVEFRAGGVPQLSYSHNSAAWDLADNSLVTRGVLRMKAVPTGSRPLAASVGAGAQMFDTTLGKPVWSDGTQWCDATGAPV